MNVPRISVTDAQRDYPAEWSHIEARIEELTLTTHAAFTPEFAYLHADQGKPSLRVVALCDLEMPGPCGADPVDSVTFTAPIQARRH